MRTLSCIAAFLTSVACSTTIPLTPVDGPLAKKRPRPTIAATVHGIDSNQGEIELTLPPENVCKGRWISYAGGPRVNGLILTQGQIAGVSIAPGPAYNRGEAFLTCATGGTLELEFVTRAGTAHGSGVAADSYGNIYRTIF
ncbi:MAG: hypothetical protein AAFQ82_07090 [Myxococcota bacterium]